MRHSPRAENGIRRQWIVLICLFILSLPAVTPRIYSSDEIQYFAYLRSLWFDRDLSFENEYTHFYEQGIARSEGFHETFLERTTEAGRRINFGTIGCAILWAPFYAVGDVVARATGAPADGYSKPYVAAVAYGSAWYGFAAVLIGIACARRLGFEAFAPGLLVWLGTPLLFYMYVAPPFSHACSAFAVALFVYTWLRVRGTWSVRGMVALGAAGALMAMVREQDLFFVAGPALDFALDVVGSSAFAAPRLRRDEDGGLTPIKILIAAVAGIAAFAVTFLPQAVSYVRLNGHLGPSRLVTRKMSWHAPHALQVLFSPEHGLFVWTPLALIGMVGLAMMWIRGTKVPRYEYEGSARIAGCMLLMIALQVYVSGSVESWTVAGGFGQRRFVAITALLIVGCAAADSMLRAWSRPARRVFVAVCVLAAYWNLALIAEFAVGLMDRQRLNPRTNAYHAFVTLPREAPSLAYRYLFDRSSFYQGTGR